MAAVAESRIAGLAQRIEVGSTLSCAASAASAAAAVAVAALLAHLQNEAERNIAISFWLRLQLAFNLFAGEIAFSLPLKSRLKTVQVLVRECVGVCDCVCVYASLHCVHIFVFYSSFEPQFNWFCGQLRLCGCQCMCVCVCLCVCLSVCVLYICAIHTFCYFIARFNCGPSEFNVCARK